MRPQNIKKFAMTALNARCNLQILLNVFLIKQKRKLVITIVRYYVVIAVIVVVDMLLLPML